MAVGRAGTITPRTPASPGTGDAKGKGGMGMDHGEADVLGGDGAITSFFARNTSSSLCLCQMTQLLGGCVVRGTLHTIDGHLPEKRTVCDESEQEQKTQGNRWVTRMCWLHSIDNHLGTCTRSYGNHQRPDLSGFFLFSVAVSPWHLAWALPDLSNPRTKSQQQPRG